MKSPTASILDSLEQDLPTTDRDVLALARARIISSRDPFGQVQALIDALPAAARVPNRSTAAGRPPFEL